MTKRVLTLILCYCFSVSCTKEALVTPYQSITKVVENDRNFHLASFAATRLGGDSLQVNFSTAWELNIKEMVVMRGSNVTQFCEVKTLKATGSSSAPQSYNVLDKLPVGDTAYYLIKYTTNSGEWGCTNPYKWQN